jgi:hypothetical protein
MDRIREEHADDDGHDDFLERESWHGDADDGHGENGEQQVALVDPVGHRVRDAEIGVAWAMHGEEHEAKPDQRDRSRRVFRFIVKVVLEGEDGPVDEERRDERQEHHRRRDEELAEARCEVVLLEDGFEEDDFEDAILARLDPLAKRRWATRP